MYQIPKVTLRKVRLNGFDGTMTLLFHKEKLNKNGAYIFNMSWLGHPEDDNKYNLTIKYCGFNLLIPKWWKRLEKEDFSKHVITTNIQQTYMSEFPLVLDSPHKNIEALSITKGGEVNVSRTIHELDRKTFLDNFAGIHGMIETLGVIYNSLNNIAVSKRQLKLDNEQAALYEVKKREKLHNKSLTETRQQLYEQSYSMLFGH